MRRFALLLICLCVLTGCKSDQPAPNPPPKSPLQSALDIEMNGEAGDTEEGRIQIRKAAEDYVKAEQPEAEVEGIALRKQNYDYNLYLAWVDLTTAKRQQMELLAVRLYVTDGGATYWKAESYESYLKSAEPCEKSATVKDEH